MELNWDSLQSGKTSPVYLLYLLYLLYLFIFRAMKFPLVLCLLLFCSTGQAIG